MAFIVKNTTFPHPFDLLAPHSCRGCGRIGTTFCDRCKKNILAQPRNYCPECKAKTHAHQCPFCCFLPPIFYLGQRSDLIEDLIHDFKYHSVRALAPPLAQLLDRLLFPTYQNPVKIVPLPTIAKHVRQRGFDHTYLIAKHLAKLRPEQYQVQKALLRLRNTVQVGANASTRLEQARQAYKLNPRFTIDPQATYLLFDDVWTTGASIKAALQKLQDAGTQNISIVLLAVNRLD